MVMIDWPAVIEWMAVVVETCRFPFKRGEILDEHSELETSNNQKYLWY